MVCCIISSHRGWFTKYMSVYHNQSIRRLGCQCLSREVPKLLVRALSPAWWLVLCKTIFCLILPVTSPTSLQRAIFQLIWREYHHQETKEIIVKESERLYLEEFIGWNGRGISVILRPYWTLEGPCGVGRGTSGGCQRRTGTPGRSERVRIAFTTWE